MSRSIDNRLKELESHVYLDKGNLEYRIGKLESRVDMYERKAKPEESKSQEHDKINRDLVSCLDCAYCVHIDPKYLVESCKGVSYCAKKSIFITTPTPFLTRRYVHQCPKFKPKDNELGVCVSSDGVCERFAE